MALARYQFTVTDEAGNVQPLASVEVRSEAPGAALAALYSDRSGTTPLGNPFLADADGFAAFHVIGGAYKITSTFGSGSRIFRYEGIGTSSETDIGSAFVDAGAYSAIETYSKYSLVVDQGSSWVYINDTDSAGNPPPTLPTLVNIYWQLVAMAGSPGGPVTIPYTFSTTTTDSDPGNGKLRLDSATQNAATVIRADLLDNLGSTWTGVLDLFDASTSTVKGQLRIQHAYDETKWLEFSLTARAAPSGYRNFTVTCTGYTSSSPFANNDPVLLEFIRTGDKGDVATIAAGTTTTLAEGASATAVNSGSSSAAVLDFGIPRGAIPATGFNFDTTTTDSDPGAGKVRFNNATPASVTAIYFDNADRDGNTVSTWLDTFDDSSSAGKGTLTFVAAATPSVKLKFAVSGSVVDGTGYRKVTVTHISGSTLPSNAAHLGVEFSAKGDVGTTGATGAASLTICRVVAVSNVALASGLENTDTIDGVTLATGDRVLLSNQTAPAENGVYTVVSSGAASRDSSFTTYDSLAGVVFSIQEGTINHDTLWHVTSDKGGTIDVTALAISAVSTGGGGSADGFGRARCVATTNVALSTGLENGDSVGGVTLATGDSVLLTGQTAPAENGLYTAVASGAAARHTSFATYNSIAGSFFAVSEGTKADTLWQCTSDAGGTIDSTSIIISQFMASTEAWGNWTGVVGVTDSWGSWT